MQGAEEVCSVDGVCTEEGLEWNPAFPEGIVLGTEAAVEKLMGRVHWVCHEGRCRPAPGRLMVALELTWPSALSLQSAICLLSPPLVAHMTPVVAAPQFSASPGAVLSAGVVRGGPAGL